MPGSENQRENEVGGEVTLARGGGGCSTEGEGTMATPPHPHPITAPS